MKCSIYAAFHLGLHCLQKYLFRGFPNTKDLKMSIFRKLMEKMYNDAVAERERDTLTVDAKESIAKFDKELTTSRDNGSRQAQGQGFCGGICFALACIVVCVIVFTCSFVVESLNIYKLPHKRG